MGRRRDGRSRLLKEDILGIEQLDKFTDILNLIERIRVGKSISIQILSMTIQRFTGILQMVGLVTYSSFRQRDCVPILKIEA